jgi:hypothetical protein
VPFHTTASTSTSYRCMSASPTSLPAYRVGTATFHVVHSVSIVFLFSFRLLVLYPLSWPLRSQRSRAAT